MHLFYSTDFTADTGTGGSTRPDVLSAEFFILHGQRSFYPEKQRWIHRIYRGGAQGRTQGRGHLAHVPPPIHRINILQNSAYFLVYFATTHHFFVSLETLQKFPNDLFFFFFCLFEKCCRYLEVHFWICFYTLIYCYCTTKIGFVTKKKYH